MSCYTNDKTIPDEPVSDDERFESEETLTESGHKEEEDRRERPWKAFWPPPTEDQTGYQYGVKPGQIITISGN